MRQSRVVLICLVLIIGLSCLLALAQQPTYQDMPSSGRVAYRLSITGGIDPFLTDYLIAGLKKAQASGAEIVIIQIDTPGGLLTSTQSLVQEMLACQVPIVCWVAPSGAGAGSAGAIITIAGNIVAMAEGTNIGAAHPVSIAPGGMPGQPETAPGDAAVMEDKIVNFTASFVKSIAEQSGRSQEWAEKIVRESLAETASEAVTSGICDFIANDTNELLMKLDGRQVKLASGYVTLATRGLPIEDHVMTPQENFLHAVADPNVAYLLLTIGIMAIIYELASPGGVVAGVVGVISLLLGLTALSALEVNLGGLLLIVLAIALFILDLKMPTHGVLTAGGVVALALGSMMLLSPSRTTYPIGREVIFTVVATLTAFFVFAVGAVIKAMRKQPFMGREGYIHDIGEVRKLITAEEPGTLALDGTLWTAYSVSEAVIPAGEHARVVKMEGLKLWVEPLTEKSEQGQEGPEPSSAL